MLKSTKSSGVTETNDRIINTDDDPTNNTVTNSIGNMLHRYKGTMCLLVGEMYREYNWTT